MRVNLLCPGPSLAHWTPQLLPAADHTIAVNRAATAFCCDAWAALDLPLILEIRNAVLGNPHLLTLRNTCQSILRHSPAWDVRRFETIEFESLNEFCPNELHWCDFSATAALVYAGRRCMEGHAGTICCFGVDQSGEADWDGKTGFGDRSVHRWEREAGIWRDVTAWLAQRNIEVVRRTL